LYICQQKDEVEKILFTSSKSIQSGEDLAKKLRLLVKVITTRHEKKEKMLILRGFILNHIAKECDKINCPLRLIKKKFDDLTESIQNNIEDLLFTFVNQEYQNGLIKFQNNYNLRLGYGLFLYHYQKQAFKAKVEFEIIEEMGPPLDVQFIIWRYNKMIDEGEQDVKHAEKGEEKEELDVVSEIAYESHFRQCSDNILKSARHFSEFWSIVINNNPVIDLKKLNNLSLKVNEALKNVQNHWLRMQHYKPNAPKACQMYSNFTKEILNNIRESSEILMKCKDAKSLSANLNRHDMNLEFFDEFMEGSFLLNCMYEEGHYGKILKASANSNKILLTRQGEIIGKNLNDLFPDFYQGEILKQIEDETQLMLSKKSLLERKEIIRFAKTNTQRIYPVIVKLIDSKITINDLDQFIVLIKPLPIFKELKENHMTCYFIINDNLQILFYSELASELITRLKGKDYSENSNFIKMFPEFKDNRRLEKRLMKKDNKGSVLKKLLAKQLTSGITTNGVNSQFCSNKELEFVDRVSIGSGEESQERPLTIYDTIFYKMLNDGQDVCEVKLKKNVPEGTEEISINCKVEIKNVFDPNYMEKDSEIVETVDIIDNKYNKESSHKNDKKIYWISIDYEFKDSTNLSLKSRYETPDGPPDNNNSISIKNSTNRSMRNKQSNLYGINIKEKMDPEAYLDFQVENIIQETSRSIEPHYNLLIHLHTKAKFRQAYNFGNKSQILEEKRIINEQKRFNLDKEAENNFSDRNNSSSYSSSGDNIDSEEEKVNEKESIKEKKNKNSKKSTKKNFKKKVEKVKSLDCQDLMRKNRNSEYDSAESLITDIFKLKDFSNDIRLMVYSPNGFGEYFLEPAINILVLTDVKSFDEINTNNPAKVSTKKINNNEEKKKDEDPPSLRRLKYSSVLILILLIIYNVIEFIFESRANQSFKENFDMVRYSFEAMNEIIWSSYLIRNIILINTKQYKYNNNQTNSQFLTDNLNLLQSSIDDIQYIVNNISQPDIEVSQEHNDILFSDIIPFYYIDNQNFKHIQYKSLVNIITQVNI